MFWDLQARSLEKQALLPIKTLEEMWGHNFHEADILNEVILRIRKILRYSRLFAAAFMEIENPVTEKNVGKALAAYERTLIANNSRFDQFIRSDKNAISLSEKDEIMLFLKTGCARCHSGPMFSDFKLHVLGVPDSRNRQESDAGINYDYAFPHCAIYATQLRICIVAGSLEQVVQLYEDISGGKVPNPNVSPAQVDTLATQMNVNFRDISRIVEFLNTLNDNGFDKTVPKRVPSGLKVGGNLD
jgi:cytochrome c peroxidase